MPNFEGIRRHTAQRNREYGRRHREARQRAFAALPEWSPCCRCGKPMWKWEKDPKTGHSALHFDHTEDRSGYQGFAHKTCNEKAGQTKGAKIGNQRRKTKSAPKWIKSQTPSQLPSWRSRSW